MVGYFWLAIYPFLEKKKLTCFELLKNILLIIKMFLNSKDVLRFTLNYMFDLLKNIHCVFRFLV